MRRTVITLVAGIGTLYWCLWAAAALWVFYPASLGSELKTFTPLSPEAYAEVRSSAIAHSRTISTKGIDINAGTDPASPFVFSCNGVPLLIVVNGPIALTVNVMADADERAPDLKGFREEMVSRFVPAGHPLESSAEFDQPAGLEAFVLKYRDGIDVSKGCR